MLYYLLEHLDRDSFSPTVLFLNDGPFVEEIKALGIPVIVRSASVRLRHLAAWERPIGIIAEVASDTDARIIHANGEKVSIFAGRAAVRTGIPSIAWLHDAPGAGGVSGWLTQRVLSRIPHQAVVTCSRWLAEEFNRKLDLGAFSIVNGLDLDTLPGPNPSVDVIKAEHGWPRDSPVVSHFARLQRWKGTEYFLDAAAQLIVKVPSVRFLVVGDALYGREVKYAADLRRKAAVLGIEDHLVFTGYRRDAHQIMAASDIVVHCSTKLDPFPTVVLEGMAMGKPVVATRTRGPEEAIEEGRTGLLVEPRDVPSLVSALERLVHSSDLRQRIGAAARSTAWKLYSAKRMALEFEDLYERLLTKTASPN